MERSSLQQQSLKIAIPLFCHTVAQTLELLFIHIEYSPLLRHRDFSIACREYVFLRFLCYALSAYLIIEYAKKVCLATIQTSAERNTIAKANASNNMKMYAHLWTVRLRSRYGRLGRKAVWKRAAIITINRMFRCIWIDIPRISLLCRCRFFSIHFSCAQLFPLPSAVHYCFAPAYLCKCFLPH